MDTYLRVYGQNKPELIVNLKKRIHKVGWLWKRSGSGKSWERRVNMTKIQCMKLSEINLKTNQSTLKIFKDAALLIELNIHPRFNYSHKSKQAQSSLYMKDYFYI